LFSRLLDHSRHSHSNAHSNPSTPYPLPSPPSPPLNPHLLPPVSSFPPFHIPTPHVLAREQPARPIHPRLRWVTARSSHLRSHRHQRRSVSSPLLVADVNCAWRLGFTRRCCDPPGTPCRVHHLLTSPRRLSALSIPPLRLPRSLCTPPRSDRLVSPTSESC
jgi:hypothetical protein